MGRAKGSGLKLKQNELQFLANLTKGPHMSTTKIIPIEKNERPIYLIRGEKVMLDRDLAVLYGVETKALNRAVKRNLQRFPSDFMFQLTAEETEILRCQ
jgi:hypothetical protein